MKSAGYPVVSILAQLNRDELVQPLRVRLAAARLLFFLPRGEIGWIAHHVGARSQSRTTAAGSWPTGLSNRLSEIGEPRVRADGIGRA